MNKSEMIDAIASEAKITKASAKRALEALLNATKSTLKKGDTVQLVGFGTFGTRKRKARKGINPRTGEALKIKATKVPYFKPGSALKETVDKAK
jgi:DNA-binding protein HU-beta